MLVYFITDEPTKLPAIRAMLEPQHAVVPWVLGGDGTGLRSHGVLMVDIDLRQMARVDQLKFILHQLSSHSRKAVCRSQSVPLDGCAGLRARRDRVISRPKEAVLKARADRRGGKGGATRRCDPPPEMDEGVGGFASMFSDVRRGKPTAACRCRSMPPSKIIDPRQAGRAFDVARRGASLSRRHVSALPAGHRCCGRASAWMSDFPAGTSRGSELPRPSTISARRAFRCRSWTSRDASTRARRRSCGVIPRSDMTC